MTTDADGHQVTNKQKTLADPGGRRRRARSPPPQQDQFLLFSHTFLPKSVRIGGWRPPPPPPQREILDPPLKNISFYDNNVAACL